MILTEKISVKSFVAHASDAGINYRTDIDGLRGVALLLVMFYHFDLGLVSGGFIGVDVFFVISGYLIASILIGMDDTLGSLVVFYTRRVKRLMPMLLLVLAVTALVATFTLLPEDFIFFLKSLRAALTQQSNFLFAKEAADYFGRDAKALPLLHTWSLSVEWQFYVLFPVIVVGVKKCIKKSYAPIVMGLFCAVSAVVSVWTVKTYGDLAYFSVTGRAVEFLSGAVLFLIKDKVKMRDAPLVATISLVAIVVAAFFFTPQSQFPGVNALFVSFLTCLCLAYGEKNCILRNDWLVGVGKISYSAYLWHWPFIAFAAYLQIKIPVGFSLLTMMAVLAISLLTHAYIERPFRRSKIQGLKAWGWLVVVPVVFISVFVQIAKLNHGFPQRLGVEAAHAYNNILPYLKGEQKKCHDFEGDDIESCVIGDKNGKITALLVGDSHARHYAYFVDRMAKQAHVKVYALTNSECLVLPDVRNTLKGNDSSGCAKAVRRDFDLVQKNKFSYVLLGQRWSGYPVDNVSHISNAIEIIKATGANPIILGPVPEDGRNIKDCFYRHIKLRQPYDGSCDVIRNNNFSEKSLREINNLFGRLRSSYPSVTFVDPSELLCDDRLCKTVVDGTPLYDDSHHINGFASDFLAKKYMKYAGNLFDISVPSAVAQRKTKF